MNKDYINKIVLKAAYDGVDLLTYNLDFNVVRVYTDYVKSCLKLVSSNYNQDFTLPFLEVILKNTFKPEDQQIEAIVNYLIFVLKYLNNKIFD